LVEKIIWLCLDICYINTVNNKENTKLCLI
jgi:hypothetical protein